MNSILTHRKASRFITVLLCCVAILFSVSVFGQAMDDLNNNNVSDNGPATGNVGLNDILPLGPRIYSLVTNPPYGTFTWLNAATGSYSIEVPPVTFKTHNFEVMLFEYQVCVGSFCDTATIEIQLRFINDYPFASNDTLYVETGTGRFGDVTPNDGDEDSLADPFITGNYMNWQIIPPSYVDTNISPIDSFPKFFGTFYYHPLPNFIGEDFFTYYNQEPNPCLLPSNTARVTIFVVPSNENPMADDAIITNAIEEQAVSYNLLPLTSDPENEVLHFRISEPPRGGVASINSLGLLSYQSTNDYIGWDTLAYTVMDLVGQLDTGYVYIQIANGNNDAPQLQNSTAGTSEDSPTNFSIATVDTVDGDALSYQSVASSYSGSYTISTSGVINYTPAANFSGTDIIRYSACDPSGLCDTASVTITITPINDAPVATADFNTTVINGSVNGVMATNDSDIDNPAGQLTYTLLNAPMHGTATVQPNGTYTYSPNELYYGEDIFTYRVCDSQGLCANADVVINVLYTNIPPQTNGISITGIEDEGLIIDLTAASSDFNGGDLSYNLLAPATIGTFSPLLNTGFNFVPAENLNGTYEIAYRVCDTGNLCDTAIIALDITAINDAPVVQPLTLYLQEDTEVQWIADYFDIDSENANLSLEILSYPQHGVLSGDNVYQSELNYNGEDAITFSVCDSEGDCTTMTHSFVVEAANDAPVASGETITISEDSGPELIPLSLNETDVDGDALQYFLISDEGEHTINFSISGLMTINPASNFNGIISLDYAVCDASGLCDTATTVINVAAVNDVPQSFFPALTAMEDLAATFNPTTYVSDIDGDSITFSVVSYSAVTATFNPADLTYALIPVDNYFGEASVIIQVCDGAGACINDTLAIFIEAVNDAPVVSNIDTFTFVNIPAEGELIGFVSDVDDDSFIALADNNPLGNLTIDSTLHFSYTPAQDFIGINSIDIIICDASGLCDTTVFTIQVFPPNQAPQATSASFEMCQAQSFAIPIASLVSDDAQSAAELSYLFNASAQAQITLLTPATEAIITPSPLYSGILTIEMIVCDNASPALCDTANYQLDVTPSFTPQVTGATINAISCNGANDGSVIINTTNDLNTTTYQWNNGSEGNAINALAPGEYAVTMISDTPCSLQGTASFTINEPELLVAAFNSTNISDSGNGSIDLIISGGTAPYAVSWSGPNGFTSTSNSLIDLSIDGMYVAQLSDANDCQTSLEVMLTSLMENAGSTFSVYPNPIADNNLLVKLSPAVSLPCYYRVADLTGKLIQQGMITGYSVTLDMSELAGGCYFLAIGDKTLRLIRE